MLMVDGWPMLYYQQTINEKKGDDASTNLLPGYDFIAYSNSHTYILYLCFSGSLVLRQPCNPIECLFPCWHPYRLAYAAASANFGGNYLSSFATEHSTRCQLLFRIPRRFQTELAFSGCWL